MTTKAKTTKPSKPDVRAETAVAEAARAVHQEGDSDLSALRMHPEFRAAIDAAHASFARGEDFSGEELDARLEITEEDRAAGEAWLDEYERELAREQLASLREGRPAEQAPGAG